MIRLFLCIFLLGAVLHAKPLTLGQTRSSIYNFKYNTKVDFSKTSKRNNPNQNDFSKKQSTIAIIKDFSYVPQSGLELLISGKGSYKTSERIGLSNDEQKHSLSLDSFWIGMNYMNFFSMPYLYANLPFQYFEPTLHISGGGLNNATSYFLKVSLGSKLTQRSYVAASWKQSYHQLHAREIGWSSASENYSITHASIEYTYKITPLFKTSFLNSQKFERGKTLRRYWLYFKKIF